MPVPEPLSAISLSAGLLGFLVGTIEKLVVAVQTNLEATSILRRYGNSLSTSKEKLDAWEKFWTPDATTAAADAVWLWGSDGAEAVYAHVQDIHHLLESTVRLVEGGDRSSSVYKWIRHESQQWTRCLDAIAHPDRLPPPEPSATVLESAALALYKHTLLKESIASLKGSIEELKARSYIEFNKTHGEETDRERIVTRAQRQELEIFRQRQANTYRVFLAMYNELNHIQGATRRYSLLLTMPHNPATCRFEGSDTLDVDLLHSLDEFEKFRQYPNTSLRFSMDQDAEDSSRDVVEHIHSITAQPQYLNQSSMQLSEDFKACFSRVFGGDGPILELEFATGTRLVRAQAALCTVVWSTILWEADWLKDICSCGLRMTRPPNGSPRAPSFRRHPGHPFNAPCCLDNLQGRHHLLIGILLAELAIVRPIRYQRDAYSPCHFRVREGSDETLLSREGLLRRVFTMTKSSAFDRAIKYCLKLDDDRDSRMSQNWPVTKHLRKYNEEVVRPLAKFYEAVKDSYNQTPRVYEYAEQYSLLWQDPRELEQYDFLVQMPGSFPTE